MAGRPEDRRTLNDYRDLRVWQLSMDLVVESYRLAGLLPSTERFGLAAQITAAAVSIPANVAEGNGRLTRGEYRNSLSNARGSLKELETLLAVAERVGHLTGTEFAKSSELCDHVGRMLTNLIRSLRA